MNLLVAQRDDRIDLGRTSGGDITSQSSYGHRPCEFGGRSGRARAKRFKRNIKGSSLNDHAQFTVTVTAVVAVTAPLEPVTVTV
jgi:hypothetical protein